MVIYTVDLHGITGMIETFESIIWNVQAFGLNDFQLILPYTAEANAILQPGVMLAREIDLTSNRIDNPMIIENRKITFNVEKGWTLEVSGRGLKSIIGRRIAWTQSAFENESIGGVIHSLLDENCINPTDSNRAIPNFDEDVPRLTDTVTAQIPAGTNLGEYFCDLFREYGLVWDTPIYGNKMWFRVTFPADHTQGTANPVIFSEEYENIASMEYTHETAEYFNAALVGGEGEGTNQVVVGIGTASGLDRYEGYVDGGSVSSNGEIITLETYKDMLRTYGREQMTAAQYADAFKGELILNNQFVFGTDFNLGDKVTVKFKGESITTRIIEMIYSEDANGYAWLPTFDWEV